MRLKKTNTMEKMVKLKYGSLRIFYLNVNGLDLGRQKSYKTIQLYMNLKEKEVDVICLTETNVHWNITHLFRRFLKILKGTWKNEKLPICLSESNLRYNVDYKPEGTVMVLCDPP